MPLHGARRARPGAKARQVNLDIAHIAIRLQSASPLLGDGVAGGLDAALRQKLSALKLRTAGAGLALGDLDLGAIDAPAGTSAQALTELIAGRLADWIARDSGLGQPPANPANPVKGR